MQFLIKQDYPIVLYRQHIFRFSPSPEEPSFLIRVTRTAMERGPSEWCEYVIPVFWILEAQLTVIEVGVLKEGLKLKYAELDTVILDQIGII